MDVTGRLVGAKPDTKQRKRLYEFSVLFMLGDGNVVADLERL